MAITDILTDPELAKLRTGYAAKADEMALVLSLVGLSYPPVEGWLNSIGDMVFTELSSNPTPNLPLQGVDRERCLIAMIASRRETLNLAVHVYMGLMLGLSVAEVANIIALAGVYSGISAYVRGIRVTETTLGVLKAMAAGGLVGPQAVVGGLGKMFAASWGG